MPIDPGAIRWDTPAPAAPSAPMQDETIAPPDPYKQRADERADISTTTSVVDTAHDNRVTDTKTRLDLPQSLRQEFSGRPDVKTYNTALQMLGQALSTGQGAQADLALTYAFAKAMDPDSVVREAEQGMVTDSQPWFQAKVEQIKKQFGMDGAGNFTPETRAALRQQIIQSVVARNKQYNQTRAWFEEVSKRNKIDPFEVVGSHPGQAYLDQFKQYDQGAGGPQAASGAPPTFDGGGGLQPATGDTRRTVDQGMSNQLESMLRGGASLNQINGFLADNGLQTIPQAQYVAARKFLAKNPNYDGRIVNAFKIEENSGFEQAATTLADNPVGAYALGAGQFLSGNTLDNLTSDPERARAAMDVIESRNPNATAVGNVSGAIMGSLLGEAGLARAGMASGFGRALAADTGFGAAAGAGAADGENRFKGAAAGAGAAAMGNIAGNALVRGVSRAIAPSGSGVNALYDAGVNGMTVGQRVANKGPVGAFVNKTEEAMQSFPIVGPAITGARQGARDEFQVGAFNEALKEVGEQLPKGMKPGTAPHAYAQKTFDRVYAEARKGMTLQVDDELAKDINGLGDAIGSLGPQDAAQLKSIIENRVNNKLKGGFASGDAYKRMISGLNDQIGDLSKNPQKQELAGILTDMKFAIENAARRHSDPEAVALLDAADAGYAKLVRIEDAARRRGGDAGTFSPSQFEAGVQNTSGGVRSKAYLRGDALMQDYATQGKTLTDRLQNSGTIDRLTATRLGLGLLLSPAALPYAPGVRNAVGKVMAPAGPKRAAIGAQLKKRAALAGKVGAATGVAVLPGTSPGQ